MSESDPICDWPLDAVFYEVSVKTFYDGNGDGVGDFLGLTQKLDYIAELGVTCIRLLPFSPSPWRDDGYDVTDFRDVHSSYGGIDAFKTFLAAAHGRGLKVAAEIVVNHTSDAHPWFEAARTAPPESPLRSLYGWSDSDDAFREARVRRYEPGRPNLTWDPVAEAYYWHRFFDHEPDLDYANPAVAAEMLKVLRFWADLGVDSLILHGAAFLVEREGTACEHLPETHAILAEFARALAADYPDLVIEADVNAPPAVAADYFRDGCRVVPNLPLAERLFQSLRQEDAAAVARLLAETPPPPAGCVWQTLLRNHDELALGLATVEERDYMLREFACADSAAGGGRIVRRLASLVDSSRPQTELLFGLLFALPGAPLIYYGDEIGMGDNVFLRGRNAVRTPMQWSADRNGGFSRADFARLAAPPVMDPVFGYEAVNVEAQRRSLPSLYHWVRRLIALRKRSRTFSRGELKLLSPANRKVLAFVRRLGDETILCVANLARTAQPVELDLSEYAGAAPVEMFGREAFPTVGERPYAITLGPHAFYLFQLRGTADDMARTADSESDFLARLPTVAVAGDWSAALEGDAARTLETSALLPFIRAQRWFGGKARKVEAVRIADQAPLATAGPPAFLTLVEMAYADGGRDLYFVPLAVASGDAMRRLLADAPAAAVARLTGLASDAVLHDALADADACTALINAVAEHAQLPARHGRFRAEATAAFAELRGDPHDSLAARRGPASSSNSLVFYGRRLLFKLFRRLEPGLNPDFEVGRFLTERTDFDALPRVAGMWEYRREDGSTFTAGILQAQVPNDGDGWTHALAELRGYYDRAEARRSAPDGLAPDARPIPDLIGVAPPPALVEAIGTYRTAAAALGRRTAEMHLALASDPSDPEFAPEPITRADLEAVRTEILAQAGRAFDALRDHGDRLPPAIAAGGRRLLDAGPAALEALAAVSQDVPAASKTRIHGDYHLGQTLRVNDDFVILDFEGEPTRTVDDRREKFSPARDVAGMLRSFHYAAYAGLFAHTETRPDDFAPLVPWADAWVRWVSAAYLTAYRETARDAAFLPSSPAEFVLLLDRFMLAKALYELVYELNNRPDWVRIPLQGVLALLPPDE